MKDKAEVVVIGGGVNGLGVAYWLAKKGLDDVVVLEKSYLGSGASGRNTGGVRQQWASKYNIILARESVKMFEKLSDELNFNIMFRQTGYLILIWDEEELEQFKKNVKLQNSLGVPSKIITPEEAKEIVPPLNIKNIIAATFCKKDGVLHPLALVWGYERALKRMGIEINTFTEVKDIKVENGEIKEVVTNRGNIKTNIVVNATGPHAPIIGKMVGVDIPITPYRHEIMVSEPLQPILDPMILSFKHGLYVTQTNRGEIIGGISTDEKPGYDIRGTVQFVERFSRAIVEIIPQMKYVNMLRQWAGLYDMTPDAQPIIGPTEGVHEMIQINGFSGHGVMLNPISVKLVAELIVDGKTSIDISPLSLDRFKEPMEVKEKLVVG